jgi:hypothetical protein
VYIAPHIRYGGVRCKKVCVEWHDGTGDRYDGSFTVVRVRETVHNGLARFMNPCSFFEQGVLHHVGGTRGIGKAIVEELANLGARASN